MTILDPPIAIRLMSEVTPGSLLQHRGTRGFCAFNARDPAQTRVMVLYDADRASFEYRLTPVGVLDFGATLIIVPNLKSLVHIDPSSEATSELLLEGDSPKILFHVEDGDGTRQLDLKTGKIEPMPRALVTAFRDWTIGVRLLGGEFQPLLDVGPRLGAAFDDDGSTEPDAN